MGVCLTHSGPFFLLLVDYTYIHACTQTLSAFFFSTCSLVYLVFFPPPCCKGGWTGLVRMRADVTCGERWRPRQVSCKSGMFVCVFPVSKHAFVHESRAGGRTYLRKRRHRRGGTLERRSFAGKRRRLLWKAVIEGGGGVLHGTRRCTVSDAVGPYLGPGEVWGDLRLFWGRAG